MSRLSATQQKKYLGKLRGAERAAREAEILYRREHRSDEPFVTDEGQPTKRSRHAIAFEREYGRTPQDTADAARLSGVPKKILDEVYARGMAAWQTGHRPGASQHAWAMARVESFLTGGPTSKTADADLAREAKLKNPDDQTETPAFKAWFGNSKVVDFNGKPLVVYHGTDKGGFTKFDLSKIDKHHYGFFFTSNYVMARTYTSGKGDPTPSYIETVEEFARVADEFNTQYYVKSGDPYQTKYDSMEELLEDWEIDGPEDVGRVYSFAGPDGYLSVFDDANPNFLKDMNAELSAAAGQQKGVYEVYLRMEDPYEVDAKGENWDHIPQEFEDDDGIAFTEYINTDWISREARDGGFDGCIIRNVSDEGKYGRYGDIGDVYVVFKPEQIKSATGNRGTFDPHDADIRNPASETHIPPAPVAAAAKRGLALRAMQPPSNRCCTPVGLRRAAQLANRQPVSEDTMRRMLSYFQRHEVDKQGKDWGKGTSKGLQAWLCWGGDEGYAWVRRVLGV